MTHGDGGKGSTQRPTDWGHFSENFDRIFGKTEENWKKEIEEEKKAAQQAKEEKKK